MKKYSLLVFLILILIVYLKNFPSLRQPKILSPHFVAFLRALALKQIHVEKHNHPLLNLVYLLHPLNNLLVNV